MTVELEMSPQEIKEKNHILNGDLAKKNMIILLKNF